MKEKSSEILVFHILDNETITFVISKEVSVTTFELHKSNVNPLC